MFKRLFLRLYQWCTDKNFRNDWGLFHPNIAWYTTTCPYLAKNAYWIFFPVALLLRHKKYLFSINNLSHSVGHAYAELDYAARFKKVEQSVSNKRLIVIWPRSPIANTFQDSGSCGEVKIIINGLLHLLIYPLLLRYKWLSFNVSISALDHDIEVSKANKLSSEEFDLRYKNWYRIVATTSGFFPIKYLQGQDIPIKLRQFIGKSPYVVLQIKELAVNASFLPTDPASYLLVIDQMIDKGYTIIFAGREKCPAVFKARGILNYSESELATPEHDYFLIRDASAVLSSASGFGTMADVMGKPLLVVNSWSFKNVPNQTSLIIPSILSRNNRRLTFKEQHDLANEVAHCATGLNRDRHFSCQDASADDVYDAWQIILARVETLVIERETALQVRFRETFSLDDPIRYACSRMSNAFLQKNLDLLG